MGVAEMKLQLIIQCIDTFGFKSPKDKLYKR